MANLFLNFIYSLTAGFSSVVSRVQNFLGAQTTQELGVTMGNGVTAVRNFVNEMFWKLEKFILGILSALEYIAYEFLGIGHGVDDYVAFANTTKSGSNPILSIYTRTFKAIAVVAIILMIVFTIFAIIRQEWTAWQAKGNLNYKNNLKTPIVMRLFRGIITIIALPVTVIIVFGAVNSVLTSFNRALQGRDKSTIASNVLATASYNSNRFRLYVEQDKRIPIVIQAYDTSEYKADESEELKYKIKSATVQNKLKSTAMDLAKNTFISFKDSLTFSNNRLTNSSKYGDFYESFVCTPEQYQVLADFVDYAERTQENFYIKAVEDDTIDWKYVSATVYNESEKSLSITYKDATKLTKNNNGLNTASAASSSSSQNDESYTITYSLGVDISSPISDAYKTMQALLGIGDYSDILYNKMEREADSTNIVHWASKKVSIHFSKNFIRDNPQTWTPTDEIIMYEYYHFAVNNTFQNYSLDDLSYQKAVEENDPVTLDAKIYTYRKYYAYADAYSPEIDVDCVYINGNYYITELSATESDKFGNPYYVLKNIEDTNFLTKTYTTAYVASGKTAKIQLSALFDINNPLTWTYSDQIIMYEYYKDLSYNNDWSKYNISNFKNGVDLDVYVITLHSSIDDIQGSSQFYVLINGVYYELKKDTDTVYRLYAPKTSYIITSRENGEKVTTDDFPSATYTEEDYELVGVDYDNSKQFLKEINADDGSTTFYNYSIELDKSDYDTYNTYDTYGISTTISGKTAQDFLIIKTEENGTVSYQGADTIYYALKDTVQTEESDERTVKLLDKNGIAVKDETGSDVYESEPRIFNIITEKASLVSGELENSLEFDNFEEYGDFDLKFSSTFDYKDTNTWNYRDYFLFYLYSKYLSVSGITLNQLKSSGVLSGSICRAGIEINSKYNNVVNTENQVTVNIYDYDEYGQSIITDANHKPISSNEYESIITGYVYLYEIDTLLTSYGNTKKTTIYLRIEDILNISQMNILNPINTDLTFNANNFDRAYESNLFIEIDKDSEDIIEFSYAETSARPFAFSSDVIYDSQSTWTVGDFILFYLVEKGVFSIPGITGSFVDMEDVIRDYSYTALSYFDKDNTKNNYYQFGTGSNRLYLNEKYIKNTLNYTSVDVFWNSKLFDFISKFRSSANTSSSSVVLNTQTIADNLYLSYSSNVYDKSTLISNLVNQYIFNITSNDQLVKNKIYYTYYNEKYNENNVETWTVLDGIIKSVQGNVERTLYTFETAYKYNGTNPTSTLCLMIDETHAIELKDNFDLLGISLNSNFKIYAKTTNENNVAESFNKTYDLVKDTNIVSFKNMSALAKESTSKFNYQFAANANLSKLDCLLIELYNTKVEDEYIYRSLNLVSGATFANKGNTFKCDIYVPVNSNSNTYYLYLGNLDNEAYFYKFDINESLSYIYDIDENYNILCNKSLFKNSDFGSISFANRLYQEEYINSDEISANDKFTLLDAIIYNYKQIFDNSTFKIYQTSDSSETSYIIVSNNFVELNSLTRREYVVQNISGVDNSTLINLIYENNYKDYYVKNSGINSSYESKDINILKTYTEDGTAKTYKNEVTRFRLNDVKTWTPLNVILYNLEIINANGENTEENIIVSSTLFTKYGETYLRVSTDSDDFDINISTFSNQPTTIRVDEKPVNILSYQKTAIVEVFLNSLYNSNKSNESSWLTFDSKALNDYLPSISSSAELKLVQEFTSTMKFDDPTTWNWYEMLYFFYNGNLPSSSFSYTTYGEYTGDSTNNIGYIEIGLSNGNKVYVKSKLSDGKGIFTASSNLFAPHMISTGDSTSTNIYSFEYNLQESRASVFGVINYKLLNATSGSASVYKFYKDNSLVYYLNSAGDTYISGVTDSTINISTIKGVKYTGKPILNKNTDELTVFDLYVKSLGGTVTEDSNVVLKFGDTNYLLINDEYINLSMVGVTLNSQNTLQYTSNDTIVSKLGIDDGNSNKLFVNKSIASRLDKTSSDLPVLPGMEAGSTIIKLYFSSNFDFSNYSTWKLSDFLLYYVFIQNSFNYNNNRNTPVTNFQEFVTKGYVESTFCNLRITDESGNSVNYNTLLIGQAIETNEFETKLNSSIDEVSNYILVNYSIFYELFTKNLMHITTYGYDQVSAPLSIELIGTSIDPDDVTVNKMGVTFSKDISTQDFIYNNNYYYGINNELIDIYFTNMGISQDTIIYNKSPSPVLIDLKLSDDFNFNNPQDWTVLEYIIIYEYSRNIKNNVFEGISIQELESTGFKYELEKDISNGGAKVVLNINGDRYNLSHWYTDPAATTLEITDNLYAGIASQVNAARYATSDSSDVTNWYEKLFKEPEEKTTTNQDTYNLRFSSGFDENDFRTWTIFDCILYYELINNVSFFQENGKTLESLKTTDWNYTLEKEVEKIDHGNDQDGNPQIETRYSYKLRIGNNVYYMNEIVEYENNDNLQGRKFNFNPISRVNVTDSNNSGYDIKVLAEQRRFNIKVDVRDVVAELENTLISGAGSSASYYKLRNIDTNEELYVTDYSEEKYSPDNFELLDDNFTLSSSSLNDNMSRTEFTTNFAKKGSEEGSSHKRVELIKAARTLLYSSENNSTGWMGNEPRILDNYFKLKNKTNQEIIYAHKNEFGTGKAYHRSNNIVTKTGLSGVEFEILSEPTTGVSNVKNNVKITYYRNLDKNVYFNYQISLTRYKNYTISTNILKVNWPQKLISDMMVIYPDIEKDTESGINWATLLATDGWIKTLGDYHSGTSSGTYLVSGNSANVNTIGLVLSEFLLSIATEPTGYARYANYEYQSIYDSSTIKALMLSILGEEEYDALVNEANIFVDLFNVGFAGILDDIASERNIKIKEGKVDGFEMSLYKAYLATAIMSSDFAEYLYTVGTRVLAQYTIYESLARSADDYDTYYGYYNHEYDSNGELINKFTYGSFKELVNYENQSLKYGKVPMFTFNLEYVSDRYKEEKQKENSNIFQLLFGELFDGFETLIDFIRGRDEGWGKLLEWYEKYYYSIYIDNNSSVSQDDPMYCFLFDVYYSIKQSIKRSGVKTEPVYLTLYKSYLDGQKDVNLSGVFKRWNIIKDVSIDGASVVYPNYTKYQLMLQLYKAKSMVSYLDFLIMPLYSPMDMINDIKDTVSDVAEAAKDVAEDVAELAVDLAVDSVEMAADIEAMKWDILVNQDDIGDRAESISDNAVDMFNDIKDTALDIADTVTEMAEKIGDRAADAFSAILSVCSSLTCYRVFKDNPIYLDYFNDLINPHKSFIYPYLKSEGKIYKIGLPLFGDTLYPSGSAGVVEGWNAINSLYEKLGLVMEAFDTLYSLSQNESNGYVTRYWGLRDNVIEEVYDKLSKWHNNVGTYINIQTLLDKAAKGSITFTLAQFTDNYKEEGYNFTIQNRTYKMKTAVSAQRIGEYVYGGEFLEHFGIPATYTSSTFTGFVNIGSGYDYETHAAKKSIASFEILQEFASQLANYTGKLYLLSNVMDLSATNNDNPIDPTQNSTDSVKMTDKLYAINPLNGKSYNGGSVGGYVLTTQEYLILDYMIKYNYLSYDTLRSLLVIDDESTIPTLFESVTEDINFSVLNSAQKESALDNLRFYLAYVQSDSYEGNYNINENTTGFDRIHIIFKKTILYLTNKVEDDSNGYETLYEGDTLSFENMYFQKLRLILINSLVNFERNETDDGEANANRYLSLYNLSNSEFDYYYNNNPSETYQSLNLISESAVNRETMIGRNVLIINNSLIKNKALVGANTNIVKYVDESNTSYNMRASFKVDTTSDGLFKKLAGLEHRPVEELVNRQYNKVYARNGCYDEELGDIFVICTYDPINGTFIPVLAEGKGFTLDSDYESFIDREYARTIESDYCEGAHAFPIIAKGVIIDGINGYVPTAIKTVNNELIFYRDSITATGDVNDAVSQGVVITEMSTSKYIKYVGSQSFSGYGDSYTMYIGANNPVAYIESDANVYYIQYTTNYTVQTEDELGAISVLEQFPSFYTFDMVFHLLMLLGFVVMIPVVFKAILLGMRRMLDLMALMLVSPLAVATNSLQIDDKTNQIYDQWKRMFTASLLTVFGIVVSFNIYYILVNTALRMTYITAGDATMTIIADSPLSFISVSFMNNLIKFFFVIIAANLVESGGKLIGRIITGGRVSNSYASQISGTEPLQDMKKIKGDLTKAVNVAKKLYSGELLMQAKAAALEAAKESVPGSAIIRKVLDKQKGKADARNAKRMVNSAVDKLDGQGADSVQARKLAAKYLENAQQIRKLKRDNQIKMANAFMSTTGMALPIAAKEGDFDSNHKKQQAKLKKQLDKDYEEQDKLNKKYKKAEKYEEKVAKAHAHYRLTAKEKFDKFKADVKKDGIGIAMANSFKRNTQQFVKRQQYRFRRVKKATLKALHKMKKLPGEALIAIRKIPKKVKSFLTKAGRAAKYFATKTIPEFAKGTLFGKIFTGLKKGAHGIRDLGRAGKIMQNSNDMEREARERYEKQNKDNN